MATCRELIREALLPLRALSIDDDLVADEIAFGLTAIQRMVREIHDNAGAMIDVDVIADYVAGENERVRVQDGYSPEITLPNSITVSGGGEGDFGFRGTSMVRGSTDIANGSTLRPPRDGVRIEIVAEAQGLYFFRSDTMEWVSCNALTIDGPMPLNASYLNSFAAMLAEYFAPRWPSRKLITPPESVQREAARARSRLNHRYSRTRDPVAVDYF